ncbi:MAG: cyclase family protein [Candidatus Heimdallarchaeota archaeon]
MEYYRQRSNTVKPGLLIPSHGDRMRFIDLSHLFEDNMPGFRLKSENGDLIAFTAQIRPFLTHEQSRPRYKNKASFEITEITFQTSVGTYLDSPYHRYPDKRDISEIGIEEVILEGIVLNARHGSAGKAVGLEIIPERLNLTNKAILINFGWDQYWGTDKYHDYPFISEELIKFLSNANVGLVGVDTINIDDSRDLFRPAHTEFLKKDILIVENLTNLGSLYDKPFRFFCVPIKGKQVAAMPVRAFAEIIA